MAFSNAWLCNLSSLCNIEYNPTIVWLVRNYCYTKSFFFHFQIWNFLWELFPLQSSMCVKSIKKMLTAANVNEHINFACFFFSPPSFLLCLNFPCLASLLLRVLFLEAAVYFEARSGESQRLQNQAQDSQCSTVRLALGTSSWPERSS